MWRMPDVTLFLLAIMIYLANILAAVFGEDHPE